MVLAATPSDPLLATLLLDLAIVAVCALAFGALARRIGQTPVIGEIVAGILLGPSLLGMIPGNVDKLLFPQDVRPYLQILANVALVLFMFGIGFEVDVARVRRSTRATAGITATAVVTPLFAAAVIAPLLWARHPPEHGITSAQFAMFLGVALSVTAFPVLGRILKDSGLFATELGSMALAVAALTDLLAWTALAALAATLDVTGHRTPLLMMVPMIAVILSLLVVVRKFLPRVFSTTWCDGYGPEGGTLLLLVALTLCAAATTAVGLHPAIGAFALGVACARRGGPDRISAATVEPKHLLESAASDRIAAAAHTLGAAGLVLVPLYFLVTGLRVDVTRLGLDGGIEVLCIFIVASGAKIVGGMAGATLVGFDRSRRLALGLLLNTRGLTELIVLDIGRNARILDDQLFTVLVLVAILTTLMTTPLLPLATRVGVRRDARLTRRSSASR